ncbi:TIGR03943 family protein [Fusibacter paucivorans]|uniref:TIGR03943 family protein n=1 Tax=Fusibacter paucivorans TaxID=76009 RepID=A0ABS5PJ35_9FIRM|nr:TIGR03943 family protein [Fusibacter paucivorans]MBS7525099.1 TIGR03943 family protein [Fusibacter paucivorans]
MKFHFSMQSILEGLSEAAFAITLFYLVASDRYLSYVTPSVKPYLYFTVLMLLLWAVSSGKMKRLTYKTRYAHCFVLLLPLLVILVPHKPIQTNSRYSDTSAFFQSEPISAMSIDQQASVYFDDDEAIASPLEAVAMTTLEDAVVDNQVEESRQTEARTEMQTEIRTVAQEDAEKRVIVGNDEFYNRLNAIYRDPSHYNGYEIIVTGFVLNNMDALDEDTFIPARLAMVCCAADLTPIGMPCKYKGASGLKTDSWVTVSGVINIGEDGQPFIDAVDIAPAEPVEAYVYPY